MPLSNFGLGQTYWRKLQALSETEKVIWKKKLLLRNQEDYVNNWIKKKYHKKYFVFLNFGFLFEKMTFQTKRRVN